MFCTQDGLQRSLDRNRELAQSYNRIQESYLNEKDKLFNVYETVILSQDSLRDKKEVKTLALHLFLLDEDPYIKGYFTHNFSWCIFKSILTLFDMCPPPPPEMFLTTVLKRFGVGSWNFVTFNINLWRIKIQLLLFIIGSHSNEFVKEYSRFSELIVPYVSL